MASTPQLGLHLDDADSRIAELLRGSDASGFPLPEFERHLLGILAKRRGAENAIQVKDLAVRLDVSEREIKGMVRTLVVDFGVRIGASRGSSSRTGTQPAGYYIAIRPQEIAATRHAYVSEIRALAKRIKVLEGPQFAAELFGQLALEMTAPSPDSPQRHRGTEGR